MSNYTELKARQQAEVNAFPFFYAFSDAQFEEGMAKVGLAPNETDKIYSFGAAGCFYRREDSERLSAMFLRLDREIADAIAADTTGEGFIFEAFVYELADHEYPYANEIEAVLDTLNLDPEDIEESPALTHGLTLAKLTLIERAESADGRLEMTV